MTTMDSTSQPLGAPAAGSTTKAFRVVVISAGTGNPSTTRAIATAIAAQVAVFAHAADHELRTTEVELRELANDITGALATGVASEALAGIARAIHDADGVIVSSPVFKAKANGLLSLFVQVLERDLFIAKPVVLAATAGTIRHTLVVDSDMREQFAYLRALVTPTGVFAASEELNSDELSRRIRRAAAELWTLIESGVGAKMRELSRTDYTTDFGSTAAGNDPIDFDSDLMRLATGGSANT